MTSEPTEEIYIAKTILQDVDDGERVVGQITGSSLIDEQGRWLVELTLMEPSGNRGIDVVEGDEFDFAGSRWRVDKVPEPTTAPRGSVAKLVRISQPED